MKGYTCPKVVIPLSDGLVVTVVALTFRMELASFDQKLNKQAVLEL